MSDPVIDRQQMDVDIVCVGFGPATAGFLTTLAPHLLNPDGTPGIESPSMPGMPLQVICYERADDIGFGVSGIVTRARGIRASMPGFDFSRVPMAAPVVEEKVAYLLDPAGASRRSAVLHAADATLRTVGLASEHAYELPYLPPFLHKTDGVVMSMGQFMQFIGGELMGSGAVQIWPAMPVQSALVEDGKVLGVRLTDQGVDKNGAPDAGFMPGMDVRAALTVVGDGPVGAIGRQLDGELGMPEGHHQREWAVGMKMVIDLPESCTLKAGTVFHTFGYPEPEIFGFLYVHPDRVATVGIFVPSWMQSPLRTSYRYLQHYILHPYLWKHLQGGRMRSWGAKSLQESGRRGEPFLAGDGWARIGEGSGSTNVLTGSGVDEAWTTGTQLAESVVELLRNGQPLNRENLERTYVKRRRESWVEKEGRVAEKARDGFNHGLVTGMLGMALAGFSGGQISVPGDPKPLPTLAEYYRDRLPIGEIEKITADCRTRGVSCSSELMDRCGWPAIPYDGQLLVTHQDALLMGGKVQAPAGYADHVRFIHPDLCGRCSARVCIEMCSGQAIVPGPEGLPVFDRDKCVHCGACLWNCTAKLPEDPKRGNVDFRAGAGGLHSSEN
jgi:electron-transferring-flavoprotein dehydrogenase